MLFSLFLSHYAARSESNFEGFWGFFWFVWFCLAGVVVVGWLVVVFLGFLHDRNCKIVHFLSRCSDVLSSPAVDWALGTGGLGVRWGCRITSDAKIPLISFPCS